MFHSSTSTKGLVDKATADDDAPTPGYLYNDIAKATLKSLKDCQTVEDQLLTRLTKNVPPAVKLKCLRVAKHCVLKGDISFKRDLQRRLGPIRACLEYRGPADPIHGDALYRQVREEAQELMNAIFDTEDQQARNHHLERADAHATSPPSLSSTEPSATAASADGHQHAAARGASSASSRINELFNSFKGLTSSPSSSSSSSSSLYKSAGDASFARGSSPQQRASLEAGGHAVEDGRKHMVGMGNTDYTPQRHTGGGGGGGKKDKQEEEGLFAKLKRASEAVVSGTTSNLSAGAFAQGSGSYCSPTLPQAFSSSSASASSSSSSSSSSSYVPGVSPDVRASGTRRGGSEAGMASPTTTTTNIWERDEDHNPPLLPPPPLPSHPHPHPHHHHHHNRRDDAPHHDHDHNDHNDHPPGRHDGNEGGDEDHHGTGTKASPPLLSLLPPPPPHQHQHHHHHHNAAAAAGGGAGGESEGEGGAEERLVDEIASPGGVRAAPPASVLAQFCLRCGSLPREQRIRVLRLLLAKLVDEAQQNSSTITTSPTPTTTPSPSSSSFLIDSAISQQQQQQSQPQQQQQQQLRVLHVVAGLLKRRVEDAHFFFEEHVAPFYTLASSPVASTRAKAREVLDALGQSEAARGSSPSPSSATTLGRPLMEGPLLPSFSSSSSSPYSSSSSTTSSSSSSLSSSVLFAGLCVRAGEDEEEEQSIRHELTSSSSHPPLTSATKMASSSSSWEDDPLLALLHPSSSSSALSAAAATAALSSAPGRQVLPAGGVLAGVGDPVGPLPPVSPHVTATLTTMVSPHHQQQQPQIFYDPVTSAYHLYHHYGYAAPGSAAGGGAASAGTGTGHAGGHLVSLTSPTTPSSTTTWGTAPPAPGARAPTHPHTDGFSFIAKEGGNEANNNNCNSAAGFSKNSNSSSSRHQGEDSFAFVKEAMLSSAPPGRQK